jgi:misacylated tRNA(Ala) deacylase
MTTRLYLQDAYIFEHEATITGIDADHHALMLDRTCMYPGGGGQPSDTGHLIVAGTSIPVLTVHKSEDAIWHTCDTLHSDLHIGAPCSVKLDADRRLRLMRFHTAFHILNTIMLRAFDGWITGVRMGADRSHVDFRVDYTPEMPRRLEDEVNEVIARGLAISDHTISAAEFQPRDDLRRTLEAEPPIEDGRVRVVEIDGFEAQACGGTHVRETGAVGRIRIAKVDNKGKQNRRFYVELVD